jgi:hypothetical protein
MTDPLQTAISRRKALSSIAVGAAAFGASTSGSTPTHATAPKTDRPPLPPLEIIALNRMAFGLGPESLEDFRALPGATSREKFKAYVEQQLEPDRIKDEACEARLVGLQSLNKRLSNSGESIIEEHLRTITTKNTKLSTSPPTKPNSLL